MSRLISALLLALLAGCGSGKGGESPPKGSQNQPAKEDLSDLDGLPLEEFVRALVPRLAIEPGIQNRADLAAALDQKWKIQCEQVCRIERK